jgi:hypothetical protein
VRHRHGRGRLGVHAAPAQELPPRQGPRRRHRPKGPVRSGCRRSPSGPSSTGGTTVAQAGYPLPGVAEAAAGRRGVGRPQGRPVRRRPVGRGGLPGDRVAVAGGPQVHPPGAPPEPPQGGRRPGPPAVEKICGGGSGG